MTLENLAAPGAAADLPAPASTANPSDVANPNDAGNTPGATNEPDPEAEKARESRNAQRRIDNLVRTRTEARTEAQIERQRRETLEAEVLQLRGQGNRQPANEEPPQGGQQQRAPTRDEIDQLANQRADEIATVRDVNRRAGEIAAAGLKAHGDAFKESVIAVQDEAGPLYQRNGLPTALGEAIHDADDPSALLHHLGRNPEIAESLRGLSAAALGRRIARIEAEMKPAEPRASRAPAPLKPPSGSQGSGSVPSADSPDFLAHKLKTLRG